MSRYEYLYVDYIVSPVHIEKEKQSLEKKRKLFYVRSDCILCSDGRSFTIFRCFLCLENKRPIFFCHLGTER